jgi:Ankyrin repeats (3 copies)
MTDLAELDTVVPPAEGKRKGHTPLCSYRTRAHADTRCKRRCCYHHGGTARRRRRRRRRSGPLFEALKTGQPLETIAHLVSEDPSRLREWDGHTTGTGIEPGPDSVRHVTGDEHHSELPLLCRLPTEQQRDRQGVGRRGADPCKGLPGGGLLNDSAFELPDPPLSLVRPGPRATGFAGAPSSGRRRRPSAAQGRVDSETSEARLPRGPPFSSESTPRAALRVAVSRLLREQWQNAIRVKTVDERMLPVHCASQSGDENAVRFFVEQWDASSVRITTAANGRLPFHLAKSSGRLPAVRFLAERWNGSVRTKWGFEGPTALHDAALHGHEDVAQARAGAVARGGPRKDGRRRLARVAQGVRGRGPQVETRPESVRHADGDLALHVATAARRVETALTTTTDGSLPIHEPGRGMARNFPNGSVRAATHDGSLPFAHGGSRQKVG